MLIKRFENDLKTYFIRGIDILDLYLTTFREHSWVGLHCNSPTPFIPLISIILLVGILTLDNLNK